MLCAIIYTVSLLPCFVLGESTTSGSRPQIFRVASGDWSPCGPINSTQACYKSREVVCVRTTDNSTAPWYYCTDIGLERPHSLEQCDRCAQDCAVSEWTSWTPCNCTLGFFRSRRREIVLPPRNGGKECPSLLEREKCITCFRDRPFDALPRSYTWRTGQWGSCSTLDSSADCGHGVQTRTVQCVDTGETVVNSTLCLLQEDAYAHVYPPATTKLCNVSCPCQLSAWSDWSSCTANCSSLVRSGYQNRTRDIVSRATLGGACSLPLEEIRICTPSTNACPTYSWESSGWSPCQPQVPEATCGTGLTTRFTYCIERRNDGSSVSVDSSLCNSLSRPSTLASCEIPCQHDCAVGLWSDWSECPRACTPVYSNRTRDVVLPSLAGGAACPHLVEYRACPVLPCVSWVPHPYPPCITMSPDSCGRGTHSRQIECQDYDGNVVGNMDCKLLPTPPSYKDCYKPCSNDCVVSEWSDWSKCSETCDGIIGTQSRQRYFVALGTSCPYTDTNLTEIRNCSNPQPCLEEKYYIIEDPWGRCEEQDSSQSSGDPSTLIQFTDGGYSTRCGVGLQNRTAVCMRGDNAVPPDECPISYEPLLERSCNLPCASECVYSEWTPYSECSVTCGTGMKIRSRRLLQFSSSNIDCMVDGDGFQVDAISCENPMACPLAGPDPKYAWYLSNYDDCILFSSIQSQLSGQPPLPAHLDISNCGYGYQNRSVNCHEISTGLQVSDEFCLQDGIDRPSEVQSCEVACRDRCIVTEWSSYSQCTADSDQVRSREIVSCSRQENDWEWCCPELSSLQLSETVACERPNPRSYVFTATSRYGECIISERDRSCGNGDKHRQYECVDSRLRIRVPEEFCQPSNFVHTVGCSIRCETNCRLDSWSEWGPCSTSCGIGIRNRTRSITRRPDDVGRPCGPLIETDVCENTACPYAEYAPGPFSGCILGDSNSTCGIGAQMRQVLCLVDSSNCHH